MPGAVLDRTIWAGVVVTERGSRYPGVGMDVQSGPVEAGEQNLVDRLRAGDDAAFTRDRPRLVTGDDQSGPAVRGLPRLGRGSGTGNLARRDQGHRPVPGPVQPADLGVPHLANIARRQGTNESRTLPTSPIDDADSGPTVDPNRFRPVGDRWAGGWRAEAAPRSWGPESATLNAEARVVLTAALAELPQRQRMVVELRDVHGLSADEVCDILALSPANQRVLLHRARAKLREHLETYYTGPNEPAVRP